MPPVGFEPAVATIEQLQTHVLDRAATGNGKGSLCFSIISVSSEQRNVQIQKFIIITVRTKISMDQHNDCDVSHGTISELLCILKFACFLAYTFPYSTKTVDLTVNIPKASCCVCFCGGKGQRKVGRHIGENGGRAPPIHSVSAGRGWVCLCERK